ncbi:hypothetical protein AVEN_26010-1 [Araneus ventricosus]|uniref:Uncharacterized protein n=1 Tax=Araneus ventricosus TaxID=182803 RepID=A0A4Y2E3L9_ARAVE|nr:hypothetical protein AVEN_26010-1 [Araneus ventricosus]
MRRETVGRTQILNKNKTDKDSPFLHNYGKLSRTAWVLIPQEVVIEVLSPQFTVNWRCMKFTMEGPLSPDDLSLSQTNREQSAQYPQTLKFPAASTTELTPW